ncbi:TonB-dependent receptor domain-containing protein [Riemerella columbina]|uniref:TonB-dependent receptor domain-containing protein n=1 Tax=Riemerella columbina TaxID=103810 RepID=UPI0026707F86|nr:TonB-dependent receptor [Riemerella columbina]WKS94855.1 TonB-dependent receptor [Riemerella columbina]
MKFKTILTFLFLLITLPFGAQPYRLSGKIINQDTQQPAESIQVLVLKQDSLVASHLSSANGHFSLLLPSGIYNLQLKAFGEMLLTQQVKMVQHLDLGSLTIKPSKALKAVIINAKKPLIERQVDRMVFHIKNSIYSTNTDLVEVLNHTPMVTANAQGISIVGKGSVKVMLNGRPLPLSGSELASYLKGMQSNDVLKVEVITSPPAQYDAEGNGGLINIITQQKTQNLWSGNYATSGTLSAQFSNANHLGLNYRKNDFQALVRLRQSDQHNQVYENQNLLFTNQNQLNSHTDRNDTSQNWGTNMDLSYQTSKNNRLGLVYDFSHYKNQYDSQNTTCYFSPTALDSTLYTSAHYHKPTTAHTLSFYDDYQLDSLGSKLSFAGNYFNHRSNSSLLFSTPQQPHLSPTWNTSRLHYQVISGQVDWQQMSSFLNYETGIKWTQFDNESIIQYYTQSQNQWVIDHNRNNQFQLRERYYAAYLSLKKTIADHWTFKLGGRYEYTTTVAHQPHQKSDFQKSYGNFFPNVNVMYQLPQHSWSLNYNKRIHRPSLGQLNPFKWYANPYMYHVGNPLLLPSITHNLELNYVYNNAFMVGIFGTQQNDAYGAIVQVDHGIKSTHTENVYTIQNLGINLSLEQRWFSFWNFSANATAFYSQSKTKHHEVKPLKGYSLSYSINNAWTINADQQWIFFVNFWSALPGKESNVATKSLSNLSFGTRFNVLDKKLNFNIRINDVLKGTASEGFLYYDDFHQFYSNYYDNRSVVVTVTYHFGENKTQAKNINFNDQYRAN